MNDFWFKVAVVMLALFGIAIFVIPAKAQQPQQLAVCNEADHIEELAMAVIETRAPLQTYAESLNERVGTASCGVIVGIVEEVEKVKDVLIGGMRGHVIKVRVKAIFNGQQMLPVGDIEQYTVALTKGNDA